MYILQEMLNLQQHAYAYLARYNILAKNLASELKFCKNYKLTILARPISCKILHILQLYCKKLQDISYWESKFNSEI